MNSNKKIIENVLNESILIRKKIYENNIENIILFAKGLVDVLKNNGAIYIMGNGGSAADAQHFAAELVGRFYKLERRAIPAVALTTNTSTLTALSNDYDYNVVFERQLEAFCSKNDAVIGISTSGNADSVLKGLEMAKSRQAKTFFLTGETGGMITKEFKNDFVINVPSINTGRIQEIHITVIHIICEIIENELFENK